MTEPLITNFEIECDKMTLCGIAFANFGSTVASEDLAKLAA